jgi:membrane protein
MATKVNSSERDPTGARWAHVLGWPGRGLGWFVATWPVRGFREAEAGNLAAIIAFNALIALVPTVLLLVSIAGYLLRRDDALVLVARSAYWALPATAADDALNAALDARRHSGLLGLVSLAAFLWIGTGFVNALSHCLNQVYGVANRGFVHARRRGFLVVVAFAILFSAAVLAATLPTLFISGISNSYFQTWPLAARWAQALGYLLAYVAAALLFLVLYRTLPDAGQRLNDVWPGALLAGALFVLLGQAFPLYLRLAGGANRYGAALGLVSLLVTWFGAMAHVLLFGCYVNVTHRRRRLARQEGGGEVPPRGGAN